jgi:uncharacterized membrane protein HdeD (DUF308 family)
MNTKSRKQGLVLGGLLIIFGVLALLENVTDLSIWMWFAVLVIGGIVVYAIYATDREEKWIMIISYAMLAVAGLLVLLELNVLRDALVATYVLLAIALPFLVAFLLNRTNWGLLIPAYVLFVIGVMVPLIELGVLADFIIPAYILLAIAIPFFVVYLRNSSNWWALIPAGILTVIATSFLIAEAAVEYIFAIALIAGGILIVVRQFTRRDEIDDADSPPEELAE